MSNDITRKFDDILKDMSFYEKKGFDASSLKIFVKNFKEYLKVTGQEDISLNRDELTFDDKLALIQNFLQDKKAFPTIKEIIEFANNKLNLEFKDQKAGRELTIHRIISRIKSKPELKDILKSAVVALRNEKVHSVKRVGTKKELISADTFIKWAEIIKNI